MEQEGEEKEECFVQVGVGGIWNACQVEKVGITVGNRFEGLESEDEKEVPDSVFSGDGEIAPNVESWIEKKVLKKKSEKD